MPNDALSQSALQKIQDVGIMVADILTFEERRVPRMDDLIDAVEDARQVPSPSRALTENYYCPQLTRAIILRAQWLSADAEHTIIVGCKSGKSRTGTCHCN